MVRTVWILHRLGVLHIWRPFPTAPVGLGLSFPDHRLPLVPCCLDKWGLLEKEKWRVGDSHAL